MKIKFTKMHGAGNDYIYINCFNRTIDNPSLLAKILSKRHFSIGADGLILIYPSKKADAEMQMFNADGSPAEICGNGLRCVAKYVAEHILKTTPQELKLESHNKLYPVQLHYDDQNLVSSATINMGTPKIKQTDIPTTIEQEEVIDYDLRVLDNNFKITCVNMGNPHAIIYINHLDNFNVEKYGKAIENSPLFPEKTNVEFAQIISKTEVKQRTWERGSGETLACGSGASAVCVAGILTGKTSSPLKVILKGGNLEINWDKKNDLFLTGPCIEVFSGEINIS